MIAGETCPTGAIYRGNLRTGTGAPFVQGATGRAAIGLEYNDVVVTKRAVFFTDSNRAVMNGDGVLLVGRTLYVVQNRDNKGQRRGMCGPVSRPAQ
jgi:hypothetical protein